MNKNNLETIANDFDSKRSDFIRDNFAQFFSFIFGNPKLFSSVGRISKAEAAIMANWVSHFFFGVQVAYKKLNNHRVSPEFSMIWATNVLEPTRKTGKSSTRGKIATHIIEYLSDDIEYSSLALRWSIFKECLSEYFPQIDEVYTMVKENRKSKRLVGERPLHSKTTPANSTVIGLTRDGEFAINIGWIVALAREHLRSGGLREMPISACGISYRNYEDMFFGVGLEEGGHQLYKFLREQSRSRQLSTR